MPLFRRKTKQPAFEWLSNEDGQSYIDHGRFRLTILATDDRWLYQVSDSRGEIAPTDSGLFTSKNEAIEAAQQELGESLNDSPVAPDY